METKSDQITAKSGLITLLVAVSAFFFLTSQLDALVVPPHVFLTTTTQIIDFGLTNYDAVPVTSNWDELQGYILLDEPGNELPDFSCRVWLLDVDQKPCGVFDVTVPGSYGLCRVYADDDATPTADEGAHLGDIITAYVENIATGDMHEARFVNAPVIFQGSQGQYQQDLLVNPVPVPEPTGAALLVLGFLGLLRVHKR